MNRGQLVEEHLRRAGLTEQDVLEAIRAREADELKDVRYAVLEPDGLVRALGLVREILAPRVDDQDPGPAVHHEGRGGAAACRGEC